MRRFSLPEAGGWEGEYHWACFNDDCEYFRRGWVWMFDHYGVKASYRHRIDPTTGTASPLAVWSKTAIKDRIIEDDAALPQPPENRGRGTVDSGVIRAGARRKKGPR
jgi:hypothetical protein